MKARTLGIVAAAGLAALVGGCKSNETVKDEPYFYGAIEANAPACNNSPTVHMNRHGFILSCGNYRLEQRATDPLCTLQNSLTKYVDYKCDKKADEMFVDLKISPENSSAYQDMLRASGTVDLVKRLPEVIRLAEVLGSQEIDFSNLSAPACDNKPQIRLYDNFSGEAFSINCGEYYFLHTFHGNTLSKAGNPKQVWLDDWHDGSVDRIYLDYAPVSEIDNQAFINALAQIGAEDAESQWKEWLKRQ